MTPLMKAVVFCFSFCPELLPDTEGGHVSRTKQEGAVLISSAFLLMRSSSYMYRRYYRVYTRVYTVYTV